jgi:hypothetical protein
MKKTIKLTESDLNKLVKRIIKEEKSYKRELNLRDKLDDIFFRKDSQNIFSDEGELGYLSSEHRLGKNISPKQRVERIQQVISDLKSYIKDLEWSIHSEKSYIQNPEYDKIWGDIDKR